MAGVRMDELSIRDLADLGEVLIIDSVNGLVDRHEVQQKLQEAIDKSWPDRESWGMSGEAMRQQQALMDAAQARSVPS